MATYYVDGVSGNDTHAGTSFATAFATISKAASVVVAGDIVIICATGTYTLTSTVTWSISGSTAAGPIVVTGGNTTGIVDGTRPLITSSTTSVNLFTVASANYVQFRYLKFTHTGSTRGNGIFTSAPGSNDNSISVFSCVIDGCLTGIGGNSTGDSESLLVSCCTIQNCTAYGITSDGYLILDSCFIYNNSLGGVRGPNSASSTIIAIDNVIAKNGGIGLNAGVSNSALNGTISRNTIANNTSDGIHLSSIESAVLCINDNIIYGNGGYGINNAGTALNIAAYLGSQDRNAFGNNTTANRNAMPTGTNDITLTADPFINGSSGNYALNSASGGGALLLTTGSLSSFPSSTTITYADIGAVQHPDPAIYPSQKSFVF